MSSPPRYCRSTRNCARSRRHYHLWAWDWPLGEPPWRICIRCGDIEYVNQYKPGQRRQSYGGYKHTGAGVPRFRPRRWYT